MVTIFRLNLMCLHICFDTSIFIEEDIPYRIYFNIILFGTYGKAAPASWSSGNPFVSGAGGLRFKSRAGQMGHSVVNASPPLRYYFFQSSCVAHSRNDTEIGSVNLLHASE